MPYQKLLDIIKKESIRPNVFGLASVSHSDGFYRACKEFGLQTEKQGKFIFFKKQNRIIGGLANMTNSFVSSFAFQICSSKVLTNKLLSANSIRVPRQVHFPVAQLSAAQRYALEHGLSVVKPSNGAGGKGITVGVQREEDFETAWSFAAENLNAGGTIVLEEEIRGFDARFIIVNRKFSCAVSRIPSYVIGDGCKDIENLILEKNLTRKKHPHHKAFPIKFDSISQDMNLRAIPKKGDTVWLSKLSNIHQGGEAFDITNYISEELKEYAVKVADSVPGLNVVGIDFMLSDFQSADKAVVLELNTSANFSIHYAPYFGEPRNPASMIIKDFINIVEDRVSDLSRPLPQPQ